MKYLSRNDFRLAAGGLAKSSLSKAEFMGKVTATSTGKIPLDQANLFYLEGCRFKKIGAMVLTGRILPGWACLCARIDRRRVPMCYYAPMGLDDDDAIEAEGAPDFRLRESDGKIEIDTNEDDTSHIIRNQGATTGPVVEIEETAAAADNAALLIDQNATAAASYGIEIDTEGGDAIHFSDLAATGDGITITTAAAYTGQILAVNDTLVGTNGEGIIDIHTTGNQATDSTLLRLDADTGTLAGATDGFLINVDDDSGAAATSYAVLIDSANNEALHVATGKALFDEHATFTSGIDADGDLDIDFSANTEEMNITFDVADYAAGSGAITVYDTTAAGPTNASYLLRLAREANGDAQGHFILCEDNSTGADGNGDDMFKVDAGGAVTAAGDVTAGGNVNLSADSELTISAGGEITITKSYHSVDTNADGATDDLDTISGGAEGDILVIKANNSGRSVVVKHATGNIQCGADVTLDNANDTCTLFYDGANWLKLSSADNGA